MCNSNLRGLVFMFSRGLTIYLTNLGPKTFPKLANPNKENAHTWNAMQNYTISIPYSTRFPWENNKRKSPFLMHLWYLRCCVLEYAICIGILYRNALFINPTVTLNLKIRLQNVQHYRKEPWKTVISCSIGVSRPNYESHFKTTITSHMSWRCWPRCKLNTTRQ